jgi:PTS system mannose-specific IIC component
MDAGLVASLLGLGVIVGLDVVTVGQVMLGRPFVAATLAGVVCGVPVPAAMVGALLEAIALETMPFGASRYPEWGTAGVTAGVVAALVPDGPGRIVLGVTAGLLIAWVGAHSMVVLRHRNGRRFLAAEAQFAAGDAAPLGRQMAAGIAGDAVRAALVTAAGLLLVPVATWLGERWSVDAATSQAGVLAVALMVAAAATRQLFHGAPGARATFAVALVLATAAVWWR